ncbi:hypothetical protein Pmani_026765 [Petrolisthes manimaculis]|uniref:Uncharacterized protein n=1 Tax=Petrolisthes manimaculis TaxID=1843537 RepID=A0AAE1TXI3_9EUCA|nr:hypothetical protein Pmani_026765 [Petrolisthes manimaculis]
MERDKYLECEGNAIEKGRECAQGIVREEMEGKENKEGNKMMIEKEGKGTKKKDELYRETLPWPLSPAADNVAFMAASYTLIPHGTLPLMTLPMVPCHTLVTP